MTMHARQIPRQTASLVSAALLVVFASAMLAPPAAAQQTREVTLKCESVNNRPARCGTADARNPRLIRQESSTPCIRGQTWGHDGSGVWVTGGCRALIRVDMPVAEITVNCESVNGRAARCGYPGATQVRLVRQISGAPCVRGQTWGHDSDGLWVGSGCRGQFRLLPASEGEGSAGAAGGNIVTCRSNAGSYTFCPVAVPNRVTLERQLSNTRCREGRTWGYAHDGIWATNGCRARFRVE